MTNARYAADVQSVDAILTAMYDVISGPAGPRDWDRERNLFHPDARMLRGMPEGSAPEPGPTPGLRIMNVRDFMERNGPRFLTEDFYEIETGREVVQFGRWVHATSAYWSSRTPDGPPFARGINSVQLWRDAGRWWIMTVLWDWESDSVRIPDGLRGR